MANQIKVIWDDSIKPHDLSQLHYDLEMVLLKIVNNEKYLHRIYMFARKKKCTFLKQFLKQQTTHRNHMGTKWNDSGHWFVEKHLSTSQMKDSFPKWKIPTFWDKQIIHENMIGPTKKTVQTYLHQPEFQQEKLFPTRA